MVYHHGEVKYLNGNRYVGELEDGKRNGIGTYYCANGDEFTGTWKDGKRVNGSEIFQVGDHYVGDYENDLFHGKGKFYIVSSSTQEHWREGHPESLTRGLPPVSPPVHPSVKLMPSIIHYYEGEWANGKPHGNGTFHWGDSNFKKYGKEYELDLDGGDIKKDGAIVGEWHEGVWVDDSFWSNESTPLMLPDVILLVNSMFKVKTLQMRGNLSDE
ncbi:hypothetical protein OAH59_03050 [Euryarchaeota archaeon]|jgi:hypothetical protein|nr:hypothetical protein [Euryarchaeota archaeon]